MENHGAGLCGYIAPLAAMYLHNPKRFEEAIAAMQATVQDTQDMNLYMKEIEQNSHFPKKCTHLLIKALNANMKTDLLQAYAEQSTCPTSLPHNLQIGETVNYQDISNTMGISILSISEGVLHKPGLKPFACNDQQSIASLDSIDVVIKNTGGHWVGVVDTQSTHTLTPS